LKAEFIPSATYHLPLRRVLSEPLGASLRPCQRARNANPARVKGIRQAWPS
jgi:hypothetical protein